MGVHFSFFPAGVGMGPCGRGWWLCSESEWALGQGQASCTTSATSLPEDKGMLVL